MKNTKYLFGIIAALTLLATSFGRAASTIYIGYGAGDIAKGSQLLMSGSGSFGGNVTNLGSLQQTGPIVQQLGIAPGLNETNVAGFASGWNTNTLLFTGFDYPGASTIVTITNQQVDVWTPQNGSVQLRPYMGANGGTNVGWTIYNFGGSGDDYFTTNIVGGGGVSWPWTPNAIWRPGSSGNGSLNTTNTATTGVFPTTNRWTFYGGVNIPNGGLIADLSGSSGLTASQIPSGIAQSKVSGLTAALAALTNAVVGSGGAQIIITTNTGVAGVTIYMVNANPASNAIVAAGANVTVTPVYGAGGITYTVASTASGSGTVLLTNSLFVMTSGSDSTGTRGHLELPFQTLNGAKKNALPGDTIFVYPGTYAEANQWITNGINYEFENGTVLTFLDAGVVHGFIDDYQCGATSNRLAFLGTLILWNGTNAANCGGFFRVTNALSKMKLTGTWTAIGCNLVENYSTNVFIGGRIIVTNALNGVSHSGGSGWLENIEVNQTGSTKEPISVAGNGLNIVGGIYVAPVGNYQSITASSAYTVGIYGSPSFSTNFNSNISLSPTGPFLIDPLVIAP